MLTLLISYLAGRSQVVKVTSACSESVSLSAGVPQGSVLGPLLFIAYVSPAARLISDHGFSYLAYADDLNLCFNAASHAPRSFDDFQLCAQQVNDWFLHNDLLLNPSKSDSIMFGSRCQLKQASKSNIVISSSTVPLSSSVKVLGVTFDDRMSFDGHVSEVCRSVNYHLRALRHIRRSLDLSSAKLITTALVGSKLDYCNSLLVGLSQHNLNRLQRLQNAAARTVLGVSSNLDNMQRLRQLHWLPVSSRIDYKVSLLVFKTLSAGQPEYLSSLLDVYVPPRYLRSADNGVSLTVPRVTSTTSARAFSVHGPHIWNSLPKSVRDLASPHHQSSVGTFKTALKTALFRAAFNTN